MGGSAARLRGLALLIVFTCSFAQDLRSSELSASFLKQVLSSFALTASAPPLITQTPLLNALTGAKSRPPTPQLVFADQPLTSENLSSLAAYPAFAAAVVPVARWPAGATAQEGAQPTMSASLLARILCGNVTVWDDRLVQAENPAANLSGLSSPAIAHVGISETVIPVLESLLQPMWAIEARAEPSLLAAFDSLAAVCPRGLLSAASRTTRDVATLLTVAGTAGAVGVIAREPVVRQGRADLLVSMRSGDGKTPVSVSDSTVLAAADTALGRLAVIAQSGYTETFRFLPAADVTKAWPLTTIVHLIVPTGLYARPEEASTPSAVAACAELSGVTEAARWLLTNGDATTQLPARGLVGLPAALRDTTLQELAVLRCGGGPVLKSERLDVPARGATLPETYYNEAMFLFSAVEPTLRFQYTGTGSSGGIRGIMNNEVALAGSDRSMRDSERAARPDLLLIPSVAAAVVFIYNIPSISASSVPLVLDRTTAADIFRGNITSWRHPSILATNPSLASLLPNAPIKVVVRALGSGTTDIISTAMSSFSTDFAREVGPGSLPTWTVPAPNLIAAPGGTFGVAAAVQTTENSISYSVLSSALELGIQYATLLNRAGRPVRATLETLQAAVDSGLAAAGVSTASMLQPSNVCSPDLSMVASFVDAPAQNAYPISAFTYLVFAPCSQPDCAVATAVARFALWMLEDKRAQQAAVDLGFVPLPPSLRDHAVKLVESTQCNGRLVFGNCSAGTIFDPVARRCVSCSAGQYADATTQTCVECAPGSFQAIAGQTECTPCPLGTYSTMSGALSLDACLPCPLNAATTNTRASHPAECQCNPGFFWSLPRSVEAAYQLRAAGLTHLSKTAAWEPTASAQVHRTSCSACSGLVGVAACSASGTTVATLPVRPGYWRVSEKTVETMRCGAPELCLGGRNTSLQCQPLSTGPFCTLCVDGAAHTGSGGECGRCPQVSISSGLTLVIAAVVFAMGPLSVYCCWTGVVSCCGRIVILRTKRIRALLREVAVEEAEMKAKQREEMRAPPPGVLGGEGASRTSRSRRTSVAQREREIELKDHETEWYGAAASMLYARLLPKIKSLVVYAQLVSGFPSVLGVEYPIVYFGVLSVVDVANFDVGSITDAFGCWLQYDAVDQMLIAAFTPIILFVIALSCLGIRYFAVHRGWVSIPIPDAPPHWSHKLLRLAPLSRELSAVVHARVLREAAGSPRQNPPSGQPSGAAEEGESPSSAVRSGSIIGLLNTGGDSSLQSPLRHGVMQQVYEVLLWEQSVSAAVQAFVLIAFLVYPSTSRHLLSFWRCDDRFDPPLLFSDYSVSCASARYRSTIPVNLLLIALMPVGIPLAFFFLLFRFEPYLYPRMPWKRPKLLSTDGIEFSKGKHHIPFAGKGHPTTHGEYSAPVDCSVVAVGAPADLIRTWRVANGLSRSQPLPTRSADAVASALQSMSRSFLAHGTPGTALRLRRPVGPPSRAPKPSSVAPGTSGESVRSVPLSTSVPVGNTGDGGLRAVGTREESEALAYLSIRLLGRRPLLPHGVRRVAGWTRPWPAVEATRPGGLQSAAILVPGAAWADTTERAHVLQRLSALLPNSPFLCSLAYDHALADMEFARLSGILLSVASDGGPPSADPDKAADDSVGVVAAGLSGQPVPAEDAPATRAPPAAPWASPSARTGVQSTGASRRVRLDEPTGGTDQGRSAGISAWAGSVSGHGNTTDDDEEEDSVGPLPLLQGRRLRSVGGSDGAGAGAGAGAGRATAGNGPSEFDAHSESARSSRALDFTTGIPEPLAVLPLNVFPSDEGGRGGGAGGSYQSVRSLTGSVGASRSRSAVLLRFDGLTAGQLHALAAFVEEWEPAVYSAAADAEYRTSKFSPVLQRYRTLVGMYQPAYWWFELFELLRKIVLGTLLIFLATPSGAMQSSVGIIVCVGFLVMSAVSEPFTMRSDNWVNLVAQTGILLTVLCSLAIRTDLFVLDGLTTGAIGSIILFVHVSVFAFVALAALADMRRTVHTLRSQLTVEVARLRGAAVDPNGTSA